MLLMGISRYKYFLTVAFNLSSFNSFFHISLTVLERNVVETLLFLNLKQKIFTSTKQVYCTLLILFLGKVMLLWVTVYKWKTKKVYFWKKNPECTGFSSSMLDMYCWSRALNPPLKPFAILFWEVAFSYELLRDVGLAWYFDTL